MLCISIITFIFNANGTPPVQSGDGNWITFNRNLKGDRYSPLAEINRSNVGHLHRVGDFDTGIQTSFQTGPLAIDGTVYFTTYKHTFAIDGATGHFVWKDAHDIKQTGLGSHRGLAYLSGRVFRGYSDGNVAAFDAKTGSQAWMVKIADPEIGESIPLAPIAWKGMVFVGNAGGDNFGVTGRVYALDAATGSEVWHWNSVPTTGPAAKTWGRVSAQNPRAGGATWTTYSLDPDSGVIYIPTGNPAPDFAISLRPGDNLYTNCLVALDANSGHLLGYVQPTKHDFHDWDASAAPVIAHTKGGKDMAILGSKDGNLYGYDIARLKSSNPPQRSGIGSPLLGLVGARAFRQIYKVPVTRRFNVDAPLSEKKFTRFAPGTQGGVEWNGPSFSPMSNMVYTPAIDWAVSIKLAPEKKILQGKPGKAWSGADDNGFGKLDPVSKWGGYLTATDADTGAVKWKYRAKTPLVGGVTATAGGLVFSADLNGVIRAFDAQTGKILWSDNIGRPVGGGIISYQVDGHQYIAVAAGITSGIWPTPKKNAEIVIYRL